MESIINQEKIKKIIKTSQEVINDCSLENGAIVAANSSKNYYPREVNNYFYVWPRDGAFVSWAANIIGRDDISERFFSWLQNRAEDWSKQGLFFRNYCPNGPKYKTDFQPDQNGTILFVLAQYLKKNPEKKKKFKRLAEKTAAGICNIWKQNYFNIISNDLWEERFCFPDEKQFFSYSIAACISGLEKINQIFPNKKYQRASHSMKKTLKRKLFLQNYISRSFGLLTDKNIDASALGLIWPFGIISPRSAIAQNTIKIIKQKIGNDYQVYRYEHDFYDGRVLENKHRKNGAGWWPLLNFWMSIVLNKAGNRKEALKYYNQVLINTKKYIPEQFFGNKVQKAVSPLAWSHAMFILASKELGLL